MVLAITAMIVILSLTGKPQMGEFQKPSFDANAVVGTVPLTEEEQLLYGYDVRVPQGAIYRTGMCGVVTVKDGKATVWLCNPDTNTVNLKVRLTNGAGEVVGESGLVRPGEYLRDVTLTKEVAANDQITMRIMSYNIENYQSEGAFVMNTYQAPYSDVSATQGTPSLTEQQKGALAYEQVVIEGTDISLSLATNIEVTETQFDAWLTAQDSGNVVYKVRLQNVKGVTLAESGLFGTGKYVKAMALGTEPPTDDTPVVITVAAYDAETLTPLGIAKKDCTIINNIPPETETPSNTQ